MTAPAPFAPLADARTLIRRSRTGTLATLDGTGAPHTSLVTVATLVDGTPVLLLSRLAAHTAHLQADGRCALLLAGAPAGGEPGGGDPLAHPRLSLGARACPVVDEEAVAEARSRFLRRHPRAASYAAFTDFGFWRLEGTTAHLVAGFGRIATLPGPDLTVPAGAVAAGELRAVEHMNADHRDALALYAVALAGAAPGDWRCSGLDPEGIDLLCGDRAARVPFASPVLNAGALRAALVALAETARAGAAPPQS